MQQKIWIESQDGKRLELVASLPAPQIEIAKDLLARFAEEHAGGRSKPVFVWKVDDVVYDPFVAKGAQPVGENMEFPSAVEASLALGFKYNAVGMALSKAKREGSGEPRKSAVVRGVTVIYEDDIRI